MFVMFDDMFKYIYVEILLHFLFILRFADLVESTLQTSESQNPELSFLAASVPDVVLQSKALNTKNNYERAFSVWSR